MNISDILNPGVMSKRKRVYFHENQFVYPGPKGSELILPVPFRTGVPRKKEFVTIAFILSDIKKVNYKK